ncbi:MAG: rhomboid family intramembrane serine protease [Gammaproteobacteria bacterium]|nr:rhomboid family intramembrane serine protease [Gammaproteobacteria bacterium]MDH4253216.1 rhomboid family intramembrane serine protease [Gammaproteobacteria bacterium]MDH5309005.1 rhomboid family intramembrane serine protease [Gammaproteobacteria bacterium]
MNQPAFRRRASGAIPDVIFVILVLNGLAFAGQQFLPGIFDRYLALWALDSLRADFYPWQLLTYGFLHGDIVHLMFNMFMLWMFGRELEVMMGSRRFLTYYLVCVVGAGFVQLIVASLQGGGYATVGASGGVFGLLLAFGMTFPNRMVMLLFPPIPMKAKYMVLLFGLLELYLGFSGATPGIANFAHLGGMLFGFLLLNHWKRGRRR